MTTFTSADEEDCWRKLATLPLATEGNLIWRASVLPTELQAFLDYALKEGGPAFPSSSLWHAGIGNGRLRVITSAPEEIPACIASLKHLRERAGAAGGALAIEEVPQSIRNKIDAWSEMGAASRVMGRVKRELDPAIMLSPGRFAFDS